VTEQKQHMICTRVAVENGSAALCLVVPERRDRREHVRLELPGPEIAIFWRLSALRARANVPYKTDSP
jgi:hypothetical protein